MKRPQERIGLTIAATLVAIEVAAVAFFIVVAAALVCNDHPQDGCVLEGDHWGLGLSTADNVAIYGLIVVAVVVVVRGWQLSRRLGGWAPFVVRAIAANLLAIIGMPVLIEVLTP